MTQVRLSARLPQNVSTAADLRGEICDLYGPSFSL